MESPGSTRCSPVSGCRHAWSLRRRDHESPSKRPGDVARRVGERYQIFHQGRREADDSTETVSRQVHRALEGTSRRTSSTCRPQPAKVGLPQSAHVIRRHIDWSSPHSGDWARTTSAHIRRSIILASPTVCPDTALRALSQVETAGRPVLIALLTLNAAMFAAELIAGWRAESMGLVADGL